MVDGQRINQNCYLLEDVGGGTMSREVHAQHQDIHHVLGGFFFAHINKRLGKDRLGL